MTQAVVQEVLPYQSIQSLDSTDNHPSTMHAVAARLAVLEKVNQFPESVPARERWKAAGAHTVHVGRNIHTAAAPHSASAAEVQAHQQAVEVHSVQVVEAEAHHDGHTHTSDILEAASAQAHPNSVEHMARTLHQEEAGHDAAYDAEEVRIQDANWAHGGGHYEAAACADGDYEVEAGEQRCILSHRNPYVPARLTTQEAEEAGPQD